MPSRLRKSSFAKAFCNQSEPVAREAQALPGDSSTSPAGPRRHFTAAGFTLLEVMVALAVLGIGVGVVFQGFGQGLRLRGDSAEKVRMALVSESVLGGLPARPAAPEAPEEGEEDGFRWRLEPVGTVRFAAFEGGEAAGIGPGAELVEVRLTVTSPSGIRWEMHTALPRDEGATR